MAPIPAPVAGHFQQVADGLVAHRAGRRRSRWSGRRAIICAPLLLAAVLLAAPQPSDPELVDLRRFVPSLRFDIRYATTNNFTGRQLYPDARCFLRRPVAERLAAAQKDLQALGLGLLVFDAFRPLEVQRTMWDLVPDPRYVANPAKGSRHNRGAAVDVTLVTTNGTPLAMPTEFDDFTEQAHRDCTNLSPAVIRHRELLESAMERHGFVGLATEWWHFDATNWESYPIIEELGQPQAIAPPRPLEPSPLEAGTDDNFNRP